MSNKNTAASLKGIDVPASPFMNPTRISRINEGRYEHEEIEGALSVVNESDRILELGAGIGLVGAICAANAKPERILSYEANPSLLPFINELYEMNGVDDRIEVRNQLVVAGPDRPETMTFHVHRSFLGSSLTPARPSATHPVEIPTVSFEAVREEISPTIIVCDIEGGELDLLENADLSGVRALVIEFHPKVYGLEGMRRCKTVLNKAGFEKQHDVSTRTVWTCVREL